MKTSNHMENWYMTGWVPIVILIDFKDFPSMLVYVYQVLQLCVVSRVVILDADLWLGFLWN